MRPVAVARRLRPGELVAFTTRRVCGHFRAIGFVVSEARHVVDALRACAGALVRSEVTDQVGATARNGLAPIAGMFLELGLLHWVDVAADHAGQHSDLLLVTFTEIRRLPDADASATVEP